MSEATHTPGPWKVSPKAPCRVNVAMDSFLHPTEPRKATGDELDDDSFHDDWNICQTNDDHYCRSESECEANALLISAAPDLLEYALLEAEFTRLCNRFAPDYDPDALMRWIDANGIENEPVGSWLGIKRTAAIAKAKG